MALEDEVGAAYGNPLIKRQGKRTQLANELRALAPTWEDALDLGAQWGRGAQARAGELTSPSNWAGALQALPDPRAVIAQGGDPNDPALQERAVELGMNMGPLGIGSISRKAAKFSTQLKDISRMPTKEAIEIASTEPHLIKGGEGSPGYYVGGPRDVKSKRGLDKVRAKYDEFVAADPRGADWYDRYRAGVKEVTGGDARDMEWMSKQQAQFSAGVDPVSELQFALRENNGSLAGMPVKSARPAQHEAHLYAIEENDPNKYMLGEKTGKYADSNNPNLPADTATGTGDFRHGRNFGYTEFSGDELKAGMKPTQHTFLAYETALAVDRANKAQLGGRSDWTGPMIQAAPWVRQKALALLDRRPKMYAEHLQEGMPDGARLFGPKSEDMRIAQAKDIAYDDAHAEATKTIADGFNKHAAFATHEAQPGAATGHLPGSVGAPEAQRLAYALDPRSSWANAPGGRDAIYGGLRVGDTGVSGRVLPTRPSQGIYQSASGALEANPGEVARPLIAFTNGPGGTKSFAPADRALLQTGESTRAYIDAQEAGAAHKPFVGGRVGDSNSMTIPMSRAASLAEMLNVRNAGARHGLPDAADTGQGITLTNFGGAPPMQDPVALARDVRGAVPSGGEPMRSNVDSVYADFVDAWKKGEGSGAATKQLLGELNVTPQMRAAFDNNPHIPQNALARLERDNEWQATWGATRKDLQNARRIISEGPGWIGRLESALKSGAILPSVFAALVTGAALQQQAPEQQ